MSPATTTGWPAPSVRGPVRARVPLPGSKSMTNRALLLAALSDRSSRISRPLLARDTQLMLAALRRLGVSIEVDDDLVTVQPSPLRGPAGVDCGLAGTVMRFVPPVAALASGAVDFDGDPRARERPMGPILRALRDLGVDLSPAAAEALPFTVHGEGSVRGGVVTLDASASSQFVSALLLAGCRYDVGIDVRHDGKPMPSLPHVEMTVAMLRERSVEVDDSEPDRWVVTPTVPVAQDIVIEPDLSNAAPFLAAAAVTAGSVTVPGWPGRTTQAGDRLREIFDAFGADVLLDDAGLTITGRHLDGVDLDLHDVGELAPVVAAVAAFADSPSRLRGIAHLRGHETDRLAALSAELNRLGGDVRQTDDGLEVRPTVLTGGRVGTYDDHRMAHAAAVLGLRVEGIEIDDIATTDKTHPDFADAWTAMLA